MRQSRYFIPANSDGQISLLGVEDGVRVEGLKAVGRATVLGLQMNRAVIVAARRRWVASGWHPPEDD